MNVMDRINRILFILSFVSQNQGISVDQLAEKVGMRPRQLIKELEFISLIGKPPFKPDDYIDIYVENQKVFIEFDQSLNRPIRLTRPEAVSLLLSLELLDPEVDTEGIRSLKDKISHAVEGSLVPEGLLEDRILLERPSHLISDRFNLIRQAVEEHRKLRIEYFSFTRNKTSTRVVHPYFLMNRIGFWYLTGYCEARKDLRTFKFERILEAKLLSEGFKEVDDFDMLKYKSEFLKSMGEHKIEILFDASIAPWILEQWGDSAKEVEEGKVLLTLYSETLEFPSRVVLGAAPHAKPLSPPELIEKVKKDSAEILALYR